MPDPSAREKPDARSASYLSPGPTNGHPPMSGENAPMNIAEFLLARIAEDEANARRIPPEKPMPRGYNWGLTPDEYWGFLQVSPLRVLAECEAKRQIVAWHAPVETDMFGADDEERTGVRCSECWDNGTQWWIHWPCRTLQTLALPYADHRDYRAEWDTH